MRRGQSIAAAQQNTNSELPGSIGDDEKGADSALR